MATGVSSAETDLDSFWSFINTDEKGSLTVQELKKDNENGQDIKKEMQPGRKPENESDKGKATEISEVITTNKTEQHKPNNPEELKPQVSEQETKTNLNSFWSFINTDGQGSEQELMKDNGTVQDPKKEVQIVEENENNSAKGNVINITDVMNTNKVEDQKSTTPEEIAKQGNKQETKHKVYDISTVFKRLDDIESFGVDDNNDEDDVTNYMNDEEDDIDKEIFADFEKRETKNSGDKDFYPEVKEEVLLDPEDAQDTTGIWKALGFPDIDYWKASYAFISLVGSVVLFNGLIDIFKAVLNINRFSPIGN